MVVPPEIARAVVLRETPAGVCVSWSGAPALVGVMANSRLVHRTVSRRFRQATKAGATRDGDRTLFFPVSRRRDALDFAAALRTRVTEIASQPLRQGFVEETLQITRHECNRWAKDGRLKTSGRLIISRTETVRILRPTFAPAEIERLLGHPEEIRGWRSADAQRELQATTQGQAL